ncbi:DUF1501 domain-containing protein [Fuerstiella marisgermanici]|uniref:DUF1501 domain-containing protein n=1 Tax=Fuerstiella marisgermanici TaxID=1891926 RepID=A0A1P8WJY9_9PLAN|nr:DUF1501 domain-containing protein [Fuerstiella marisgermanici]APZ94377.1 hypothetical protein Fuma_04009 [Fuerstiella marisgermanici]
MLNSILQQPDHVDGRSPLIRRRAALAAGALSGLWPGGGLKRLLSDDDVAPSADAGASAAGGVKRVIFLFMNGGPSQIDTFDPKPELRKFDGKSYSGNQKVATGTRTAGTLWASEFQFSQHGESGLEVSELYPQVARFADDLCVIRSMQSRSALHAPAILEMNTGRPQTGAASLGAWIDFGLGAQPRQLPTCVVLPDHRGGPIGGHTNWNCGPLPVSAATLVRPSKRPVINLQRERRIAPGDEQQMRGLLKALNQHHSDVSGYESIAAARERAYELAWRMEVAAPEAMDLTQETEATQRDYGLQQTHTRPFGTQCLLAKRMVERGVRFVQVYSGGGEQKNTWDSHTGHVARHRKFCAETDQPIAALLNDLKQTGLWDDTLVIWGGEFGRTPTREASSNGRDHNPHGFSVWLAGGCVKGGQAIGATDSIGLEAIDTPCSVADLHATVLHLLGLDHNELRFYRSGMEVGLTGPEPCRVIDEVLA